MLRDAQRTEHAQIRVANFEQAAKESKAFIGMLVNDIDSMHSQISKGFTPPAKPKRRRKGSVKVSA